MAAGSASSSFVATAAVSSADVALELGETPKEQPRGVFSFLASFLPAVSYFLPGGSSAAQDGVTDNDGSEVAECLVCMGPATFAPSCGHQMCRSCACAYVREQLGHREANVTPEGVRCPLHVNGCHAYIDAQGAASKLLTALDLQQLDDKAKGRSANWLAVRIRVAFVRAMAPVQEPPAARLGPPVLLRQLSPGRIASGGTAADAFLTVDELLKLERYAVEASLAEQERVWCPSCLALCLLPEGVQREIRKPAPSRLVRVAIALGCKRRPLTDVKCPHCSHHWDPLNLGDRSYEERASEMLIKQTSRQCPNCSYAITHFHGHACHHMHAAAKTRARCA